MTFFNCKAVAVSLALAAVATAAPLGADNIGVVQSTRLTPGDPSAETGWTLEQGITFAESADRSALEQAMLQLNEDFDEEQRGDVNAGDAVAIATTLGKETTRAEAVLAAMSLEQLRQSFMQGATKFFEAEQERQRQQPATSRAARKPACKVMSEENDCGTGAYCATPLFKKNKCTPKHGDGDYCSRDGKCQSGYCKGEFHNFLWGGSCVQPDTLGSSLSARAVRSASELKYEWSPCADKRSKATCPTRHYTATSTHNSGKVYLSDGTKVGGACAIAWQEHYRCEPKGTTWTKCRDNQNKADCPAGYSPTGEFTKAAVDDRGKCVHSWQEHYECEQILPFELG